MRNIIPHGHQDPISKKYWNNTTLKWLTQKPRPSAKGANLGKAINKTKGLIYSNRLKELRDQHPGRFLTYAWLPINLSIEKIWADAHIIWKHKQEFDIDKALALSTLLIIKRTSTSKRKRQKYIYKNGYTNVHSDSLKEWVHTNDYLKYIDFFREAGYLEPGTNYASGQYAKMYKWCWHWLKNETDARKYHRVVYQMPKTIVKLFEQKEAKRQNYLQTGCRQNLIKHVYTVASNLDVEAFSAWAFQNTKVFKGDIDLVNNLMVKLNRFRNGEIYINQKCGYGERFHSIFTNTPKEIRPFIRINNLPVAEIDIKNSQFFFLAAASLYQDECYNILNEGMSDDDLSLVFKTLKHFYTKYQDVKEFIDCSLDNTIYELLISRLGTTFTKKKIKNLCFRVFFSKKSECIRSKEILKPYFPNLIRMSEIINTKSNYPLPMILQRLESRVFIQMIAEEAAAGHGIINEYITVHDSIIASQTDAKKFENLIKSFFLDLGLPVPILETTYY